LRAFSPGGTGAWPTSSSTRFARGAASTAGPESSGTKRGRGEEFLRKEHARALSARRTPPCGKPLGAQTHPTSLEEHGEAEARKLVCFHCGIECDLEATRERRKEYLLQLESHRPVESGKPPGSAMPPGGADAGLTGGVSERERARARNRRPRTAIVNRESTRYRLLYAKVNRARYLSHLDLVRMVPRLFRRAGLSPTYRLGFHPKPRMAFLPALPLGWASRGELVDVSVEGSIEAGELVARLNGSAPEGLRFLAALVLTPEDAPLSRIAHASDYLVSLPTALRDRASLEERLGRIASGEAFEISRRRPGETPGDSPGEEAGQTAGETRGRTPGQAEVQRVRRSVGPTARKVGIQAGGQTVRVVPGLVLCSRIDAFGRWLFLRLRIDIPRAARPDDLASFLLGSPCPPQDVERLAVWSIDGGDVFSPLDLERIRALAPAEPRGPQAEGREHGLRDLDPEGSAGPVAWEDYYGG